MTDMNKQTEALKLAEDALKRARTQDMELVQLSMIALAALREALAEQPAVSAGPITPTMMQGPTPEQKSQMVAAMSKLAEQSAQQINPETRTKDGLKYSPNYVAGYNDGLKVAQQQEPVANEVPLNIIRWWPDGFAERLEHVWKDLIGFIPNYKLHDLQRMLAEFGFTMVIYEGGPPAQRKPLTDEEIDALREKHSEGRGAGWRFDFKGFARAIEAAHGIKEKNCG